ncbi:MAG: glycosyltransferase family 9 protein [Bacteroidia bacterium]
MKKKILVIRFSSIGDIVLTSPVIRCLHNKGYEVHYLCKQKFYSVVKNYTYIDKIYTFEKYPFHLLNTLKQEDYYFIADLQNNWKSRLLCVLLNKPYKGFPKLNFRKWLVVLTKQKWLLPKIHIVDRYFKTIEKLDVSNDLQGLDFFIDENSISSKIKPFSEKKYIALVVGGSYYTKQIPLSKIEEILKTYPDNTFIAVGDKNDYQKIQPIESKYPHLINLCGQTNIDESAYLIQYAQLVITSDTGMMHIAAAFKKKIISLWGNTIPAFGMYPYMPAEGSVILENNQLWCRPCSKLGYSYCPLGHFKCMNSLDIISTLKKFQ